MSHRPLRIFDERVTNSRPKSPAASCSLTLRQLLPLIARARREHRAWLRDFLNDEVRITGDLYEVLMAFEHVRPSA